jgi:hypothetical protein
MELPLPDIFAAVAQKAKLGVDICAEMTSLGCLAIG